MGFFAGVESKTLLPLDIWTLDLLFSNGLFFCLRWMLGNEFIITWPIFHFYISYILLYFKNSKPKNDQKFSFALPNIFSERFWNS
jgi:hypothetical protein